MGALLRQSLKLTQSMMSMARVPVANYHEKVIDHYENPRNVGKMDPKSNRVGTGLVDAKFKTFGCGSAIASSSLATEWIKGKQLTDAAKIKNSDIAKELSLPPVKLHCSMLAEDAIQAALKDYKVKQEKAAATAN